MMRIHDLCTMLGLKMPTDPRWVQLVEQDLGTILSDHAWCEQKAALNAISMTTIYPQLTDMVRELIAIAREELEHFGMVHEKIIERGLRLATECRDPYVNDLRAFTIRNGTFEAKLVDRLLFAAMIEARSCERFKMLSERIKDTDLRTFYRELMISEANHYTAFLGFARKYGGSIDVDARWRSFLAYEAGLMERYGKEATMHG